MLQYLTEQAGKEIESKTRLIEMKMQSRFSELEAYIQQLH